MRLIETADDELFEAVSVACRLGRAGRLLERLEERCRKDPEDPEAAFRYALALLAALPTTGSELEAYGRFGAAADALDLVVAAVAEHWPARLLRIRLRCLLAVSRGVLGETADAELSTADAEIDALIDLQSRAGCGWQPCFAATFLLAAQLAEWPGRPGRDPRRAAALRARAERDDGRRPPSRGLAAMVYEPVVAAYDLTARRGVTRPDPEPVPAPDTLTGRDLPAEAAEGLGRLMDYLRAHLRSFDELPDASGGRSAADFADVKFDLEDIRRMAGGLRDELRSWASGDAAAAERARAAIPGMWVGLEDFLTYYLMTVGTARHLDGLDGHPHDVLQREMRAVRADVERLIALLVRCEDRTLAPA